MYKKPPGLGRKNSDKNDAGAPPASFFGSSTLRDRAHGAGTGAGTAVQAGAGVDHIVVSALRNRARGAGIRAGAAADAGITDNIGHR